MRLVLLIAFLLLAGCASPEEPSPQTGQNDSAVFVEDYDMGGASIPKETLQNATLGAEHVHDAWGEAEQLVLLAETREAGDCEGVQDAVLYAGLTTFNAEGPAYGCARVALPEGVVVPEGTGVLRIDVDATGALKSGSMQFQFRNKAREERLDATAEPVHTWEIPLTEADWDIAHAPATTFVMYVGAVGPGALFQGPVALQVTAIKQTGWEPVLAIAHVDHWKLPELHDMPAPGVMRLLEGEGSVTNFDPDAFLGEEGHDSVALADIVAPGTRHLVVVADTIASDCAPVLRCWYVPQLHVGGYERDRLGTLMYEEGGRRAYAWSVPDEVPEDSVYADVSTTGIEGRIDACAVADAGGPTCGVASLASGSATARLLVLAWQGEVDLGLLATLAGPAPS